MEKIVVRGIAELVLCRMMEETSEGRVERKERGRGVGRERKLEKGEKDSFFSNLGFGPQT